MMTTDSAVRRTVYFRGRVQGVGFRQTVREIAERFPVAGFVENLADGRVLLVAEGAAPSLDGFVAAIAAEMDRFIAGAEATNEPTTGEFAEFVIRR